MAHEGKWWTMAEQLCPAEYAALVRVLSEQHTGKQHDARIARARKKLFHAMNLVTEKQ